MNNIICELHDKIGKKNYLQWCAGVNELYKLLECDDVSTIDEYSVHHYRIFMTNGRAFDYYPSNSKFGDLKNGKWYQIQRGSLLNHIKTLNR